VADRLELNPDEWHEHAAWWESEADRVRRQLCVDDEQLEQAKTMFGPIGEGTTGSAYQEVLRAQHAAGERLAAQAQGNADRIRMNLQQYAEQEESNRLELAGFVSAPQVGGSGNGSLDPRSGGGDSNMGTGPITNVMGGPGVSGIPGGQWERVTGPAGQGF
jgi:Excreted virulence factor EspC, type VII ESX diderm